MDFSARPFLGSTHRRRKVRAALAGGTSGPEKAGRYRPEVSRHRVRGGIAVALCNSPQYGTMLLDLLGPDFPSRAIISSTRYHNGWALGSARYPMMPVRMALPHTTPSSR